MFRGTTPTNIFDVDVDCTTAELIYITYSQRGRTIVEKTISDIDVTAETLSVTLTQAETLKFNAINEVEIQIRVKFPDDKAIASNIITTTAERILKEGVI